MINLKFKYLKYKQKYNQLKEIYNSMCKLYVNRNGKTKESFMTTKKLITIFPSNQNVKLLNGNLIKIENKDLNYNTILEKKNTKKPKQIKLFGKIKEVKQDFSIISNNILGTNDFFYLESDNITIPVEDVTEELLNYYNVFMNKPDQIFNLNNKSDIGFFEISIGQSYTKDYLLEEGYGDGFYIETHDLPHYYYSQEPNASGYLILGEKIVGDNGLDGFGLTAFRMGKNISIYISPYTFHSDAYLIGNYNVIYGKTDNYKTYLFRKENGSIIKVGCE